MFLCGLFLNPHRSNVYVDGSCSERYRAGDIHELSFHLHMSYSTAIKVNNRECQQ